MKAKVSLNKGEFFFSSTIEDLQTNFH